jgi:hypothetical protein
VPPFGGLHASADGFTEQLCFPFAVVLQQVTAPGFPQVERFAARSAVFAHCAGSVAASTAAVTIPFTHRT